MQKKLKIFFSFFLSSSTSSFSLLPLVVHRPQSLHIPRQVHLPPCFLHPRHLLHPCRPRRPRHNQIQKLRLRLQDCCKFKKEFLSTGPEKMLHMSSPPTPTPLFLQFHATTPIIIIMTAIFRPPNRQVFSTTGESKFSMLPAVERCSIYARCGTIKRH